MSETVYEAPRISAEEYEKHKGRHVALYEGKIIADGSSSVEALEKALKKGPHLKPEQIALLYIQVADVLILCGVTYSSTRQSLQSAALSTDP